MADINGLPVATIFQLFQFSVPGKQNQCGEFEGDERTPISIGLKSADLLRTAVYCVAFRS